MATSPPLIRIAILTVSDTASANPAADASGPTIKAIVSQIDSCQVQEDCCRIVPDAKEEIQNAVDEWCASHSIDWVITTGGTGFGLRDVTPEALSPLIERPAPGLVHLMLSSSLKKTPLAALSRPVAGTINNTLVTTLPGSVKAVKENLEALLHGGVIQHAIDLIKGGSGRQVHSALASATPASDSDASSVRHGLGHGHGHHSHSHSHSPGGHRHHHHHTPTPRSESALSRDPTASVSARHRKSPFPLVSLETALAAIKENIEVLPVYLKKVDHNLAGHILAEDVYAPQNVPFSPTTSVDGYALQSSLPPGTYPVLTSATHPSSSPLPPQHIYRINTGAPLPPATDAVIMVEDTELVATHKLTPASAPEEKDVRTLAQVVRGENVRDAGSDVREGERVMKRGERVSRGGGEVGTLVFVGRKEVSVYKKPIVAIMSTGNEIVDLHSTSTSASGQAADGGSWGGIYDTNRPSLTAVLQSMGYEVVDLGIVPDDVSAHVSTLQKGLRSADLVLTTGGTSMGPTDLLKPVIERHLGGTVHFGRVGIKPGKPTTFATVPVSAREGEGAEERTVRKPVFALPGNPASALVTFYVFVLPALRQMGGWPERLCHLPRIIVQIQDPMPLDSRVEFHRAIIRSDGSSAVLKAHSTGGQRSSRVASLSEANGLVVVPALEQRAHRADGDAASGVAGVDTKAKAKTSLEAGEFAQAVVIGEIEMA